MAYTRASPHPPSPSVELEQEEEELPPQPPFTFASPISFSFSSETHDEDAIDLGYESWIQQQSKITTSCKRLWMDEEEAETEAEAINMHHHHYQEMMLRVAENLPEEAYELSLRDITELSLSPPPPPPIRGRGRAKPMLMPWQHKTIAGGFIIKLFMPSPSRARAAAAGREKCFSTTSSVLRKKSASANNHGRSMENNTYSNGYHDSSKRKSVSCYPLFNSSKYKEKRAASNHFCL